MHSQRVDHNQILQGKLAKIRQHHTTFTGYISRPQTRTDPSSTAKFAYLTRRNFGLDGIPLPVLLAARHRIPTIPAGRRVPAPGGHWTSMAGIQPESGPGQPRTISSSVL